MSNSSGAVGGGGPEPAKVVETDADADVSASPSGAAARAPAAPERVDEAATSAAISAHAAEPGKSGGSLEAAEHAGGEEHERRRAEVGRRTGRGGVAVSAAKLYFILAGLVQQVALKAVLGLEGYGALSSSLAAASIVYNPVVGASIQGMSHAVATAPEGARPAALRRVLSIHAGLALAIGGLFFCLAPVLGEFTGAPHLVPSLRLLSAVLVAYGLYAPLVGALNGQTHFGTQAALDALAATLRSAGLIAGAAWFMRRGALATGATGLAGGEVAETGGGVAGVVGAEGAALGFVTSSIAVLVVALALVGVGRKGSQGLGTRAYVRYITPILIGQVLLNLLFQADQLLLRRFSAEAAIAAGLDGMAADRLVGAYRATQLFCFLPYQLVLSVSIVIFPVVARAHREGNRAAVAAYVAQGMRIALLVSGLIVSVTSGLSGPLLELVFGAETAALATGPMRLLALGLGNLALFGVLTAILNGIEQQRLGLLVTALAFAFVVVACWVRDRGLPFGPELLQETAWATSCALLLATGIAMMIVRRTAGAVLSLASALRVGLALAAAIGVATLLPRPRGLSTLLASAVVAASYVLVLMLLGELGARDWQQLRRLAGKGR
jgi:stage V sporulation protein B